jgi:hypothetical protein
LTKGELSVARAFEGHPFSAIGQNNIRVSNNAMVSIMGNLWLIKTEQLSEQQGAENNNIVHRRISR